MVGAANNCVHMRCHMPGLRCLSIATMTVVLSVPPAAFEVGRPWSVCVNRNGLRVGDEACG